MQFGEWPLEDAEGMVLAHSRKTVRGKLAKGHVLTQADIESLRCEGVSHIMAARLDAGDLGEDAVAQALARAVAGTGLEVRGALTGRSNLHATHDGLLVVDGPAVLDFNLADDAITLATLANYVPVHASQLVATLKVIPFAVPARAVVALERRTGETRGLVSVVPYVRLRVGLIQTYLPDSHTAVLDKTAATLRQRLGNLGGGLRLIEECRCRHVTGDLARTLRKLALGQGCDMLMIAAASASVDAGDVVPQAISDAGGTIERLGMPVDPGNLLMLGSLGPMPVIGMPGCARSPKLNGFDWVLQRVAAGIPVERKDLAAMGVGGLLGEIATRPQPRAASSASDSGRVTAIVLAAGLSRRMGRDNKLLLPVEGEAMLRQVVNAALASDCHRVLVVLGHEADAVRAMLAGLPVDFVFNAEYQEGLGASVRAGACAVDDGDAVVVCLGDMPLVTPGVINRLIEANDPTAGIVACQASFGGKRGNPVLWGAALVPALRELRGDQGARALLMRHADAVVAVEVDEPGVLLDIDTPQDFADFRKAAK